MTLTEWLLSLDRQLFQAINTGLAQPWLNLPMKWLRTDVTWIPLYLGLLLYFWAKHRRFLLTLLVLTGVCFAITDYGSASILKPIANRLRPCNDAGLGFVVNTVIPCGSGKSMPSSHATNHWGMAMLWFQMVLHLSGHRWHWLWWWAGLVCLAQVYVGVHYPFDVMTGAAIGTIVARIVWLSYLKLPAHWREKWEEKWN